MKNSGLPAKELIINFLKEKSVMKQDIFDQTSEVFAMFRKKLSALNSELAAQVNLKSEKLTFQYREKGGFEAVLTVAGDTLIFHMHSNVFKFDRSHAIWKTPYIKDDEDRAYCGVINIYNFLTDSFRYNRENDYGYMIARVFINKDKHYFVEGKRQMGFLYNDFATALIDEAAVEKIVESAVLYCIDFDLLLPTYDQVKTVSISEIFAASEILQQKTGKRMGFTFQADRDEPELPVTGTPAD